MNIHYANQNYIFTKKTESYHRHLCYCDYGYTTPGWYYGENSGVKVIGPFETFDEASISLLGICTTIKEMMAQMKRRNNDNDSNATNCMAHG